MALLAGNAAPVTGLPLAATENWVLWGTLALAVVLTGDPTSWRLLRHPVTLVHEAGHAVAALVAGRRLAGIRLHSDTSGVTVSSGRPSGPGMVLTAAAGYPAPSLLGLGFAGLLALERATFLLWASLGLLALMLMAIRNLFGAVSVIATGSAVGAVLWWGSPDAVVGFGTALAWLLLVGGLRAVVELQRTRRAGRGRGSDADQLGRLSGLGATFWVVLFWLVSLGCLLAAGWLLLPLPAAAGLEGLPLRP